MVLFWLIIFAVIVAMVAVVVKKENDEEQAQQEPEKTDEDVLANANRLLALTEAATQAKESGHDDVYQAIMANTYDGPLPERRADGGWTSIFDDLRILSIAGINHRQNIVRYKGRNTIALVPEPSNEFDPDAIKVVAEDGHHMGYIHRDHTDMVRSWAHDKFPFYCVAMIQEHEDEIDEHHFYTGYLYIKKKAEG
jgi:Na+-transporting methylmalonyl-CoA/oxaloacetate decarboxylase gamma subunit